MAVEKFDYFESQTDAEELIAEFGQIGALVRTALGPSPDPWTPGEATLVYHPINVVVLPIDLQNVGRDLDGTLIKSTDQQILVAAAGLEVTPTTTDVILVDGEFSNGVYEGGNSYVVQRANTLAPSGVAVIYDLVVGR